MASVENKRPLETDEDDSSSVGDSSGGSPGPEQKRLKTAHRHVVVIPYSTLSAPDADIAKEIVKAYGVDGMGILAISGVPGLRPIRAKALPLARKFAKLPKETLKKYEHPESDYAIGWSHGKEKLQGSYDYAKGSFYATPTKDDCVPWPNMWPKEDLPEYEHAYKALAKKVIEIGSLLAGHLDRFVSARSAEYNPQMEHIVKTSNSHMGRMLHYFEPLREKLATTGDDQYSDWCGWHNDSGMLTGLVTGMWLNAKDGTEMNSPDKNAGLYITGRDCQIVKASVPPGHEDVLLFQIGETAQILSGGVLQATPHAVKAPKTAIASRETMAVFMEPEFDYALNVPTNADPKKAQSNAAEKALPDGVLPLATRWTNGKTFGDFLKDTFIAYA